jgi:hypothetical protein
MFAIKKFQEATKVLNELSTAAVSARSEVQKLLDVLEGPVTDSKNKVPVESTDYVWPTDPALIDPIVCGEFEDCDGHESNEYERTFNFAGWLETDESVRPFANEGGGGGHGGYTGAF